MTRIDVHQHLWTERLLGALEQRTDAAAAAPARRAVVARARRRAAVRAGPRARRTRSRRVAQLGDARHGPRASSACRPRSASRRLPDDEARELLGAWDADADAAPRRAAGAGASVAARRARPGRLDRALDRGRVGLSLPADALASARGLERLGPLLERLESRGAPLFVHPGPRPRRHVPAAADRLRRVAVSARGTPGRCTAARGTPSCASCSRRSPGSRRCTPSACARAVTARRARGPARPRDLLRHLVLRPGRDRRDGRRGRARRARARLRLALRADRASPPRRCGAGARGQPSRAAAAAPARRWRHDGRRCPPGAI